MTEPSSVAEVILDAAVKFENKTHEQAKFAYGIAQKTKWVIRISVIFLTVFTVFMAFSIYSLAEILEETVIHMETMYQNFGIVSNEMNTVTGSVINMEQYVSDVSRIAEGVSVMRESVAGMEQNMLIMDKEMFHFNQDIQQIQKNTGKMSVIFDSVNSSMSEIRYNVDEISRTAKIIPTP